MTACKTQSCLTGRALQGWTERSVGFIEDQITLEVVEHTKKWVKCNKKPSSKWISSRLTLGLV